MSCCVLTGNRCDLYKSKYEQLYHMVVQTHESEKTCLEKAQQLRTDLREHKIELEKAGIRKISKSKSVGEWEKQREQVCYRKSRLDCCLTERSGDKELTGGGGAGGGVAL